ncbi:MAG: tRNA (adenosine(37)-N6)-dimethylallyltransferase MiaA [Bacteroidota bacterium]
MSHEVNTIFIICGPTAVGKTSFAIALAAFLKTEIISADSRQCFSELGIAVAKPSKEDLKKVTHHFIDSHSIAEEINAGIFEQYALQKVNAIFEKHQTAVMVGGTGLYIKAFCEGMDAMPVIDPVIRDNIKQEYTEKGMAWLQKQIASEDPLFWEQAEQENPQRLMRALEMIRSASISITQFRKSEKKSRPFKIVKIGLELPREILNQRINDRVDLMVQEGLLKEAEHLFPFRNNNALQTVGYQELFDYMEGKTTLEKAIELIKQHTRQYAKRQMTWFKKDSEINWFDARTISVEKVKSNS